MTAKTVHKMFDVFLLLCALNGAGGLLAALGVVALFLLYALTGIDLRPIRAAVRSEWHATFAGVLLFLGVSFFWLFEVVVCWVFWRHFSKVAAYMAVTLLGFWIVGVSDMIIFEVLGIGLGIDHWTFDLIGVAFVCWPCIALARWLSCASATPPIIVRAEPSAGGNAAPPRASA